ncbi:MAG: amino acid permease, partial [Nanoarchaeota archaeon]
VSIYIAMCFAELTSMYPKAGGIYEFCKHAYGRFPSFIIGWGTLIAGNITIAMLVVGAIHYLLPYDLPHIKIPLSLGFILVFNYIAFKGMKTSAMMLITFAFITIGTIIGLTIPGFVHFQVSNLTPFFVFPLSAIFMTIFLIAETFFGWETATFLAEETKDGKRVMPKALIFGTIIIGLISMLFVISSLGAMNWKLFGQSTAPLADLSRLFYGDLGMKIVTLMVYLAIIGSVAGWIVSAPRLILAMARDKLFLSKFSKIHKKYNTPHYAIALQTILTSVIVIIGAGSYNTLLLLLVPIVLLIYSSVISSVIVLRYKLPKLKRYYKVPFGKIGPIIIVLILISLIIAWLTHEKGAAHSLILGASIILTGIPVYFLLDMYYNPKTIRLVNNLLADFNLITEKISLPIAIRKKVIKFMGDIKGKTILEFGCSVGTLTMHLAEEVGKKGKIYATDISERGLSITNNRLRKKGHKHVKTLHDHHHHSRIHPDVPNVDAVVSVGELGYLKDPKRALTDINSRLKIGSKICFLDYDKFFDIIPAVEWLEDDNKIKDIFKQTGFEVKIERRQGFAWTYVYVHGKKVKNMK